MANSTIYSQQKSTFRTTEELTLPWKLTEGSELSEAEAVGAILNEYGHYTKTLPISGKFTQAAAKIIDFLDDVEPPEFDHLPQNGELFTMWSQLAQALARHHKEQLHKEKVSWIEKFGSEHLKEAFQEGFEITGLYVRERAGFEFPDFTIDISPNSDGHSYKNRHNPTPTALKLLKRATNSIIESGHDLKPFIGWSGLDLRQYSEERILPDYIKGEVIVIEKYLGKYTLVQSVDVTESMIYAIQKLVMLNGTACVPLNEALRLISIEEPNSRVAAAFHWLLDDIEEKGKRLDEAMAEQDDVFPASLVAIFKKVAEKNQDLQGMGAPVDTSYQPVREWLELTHVDRTRFSQ